MALPDLLGLLRMGNNDGGILATILLTIGISDLVIETDQPQAKITLRFKQFGHDQIREMTAAQLIDRLTGQGVQAAAQPPGDDLAATGNPEPTNER